MYENEWNQRRSGLRSNVLSGRTEADTDMRLLCGIRTRPAVAGMMVFISLNKE